MLESLGWIARSPYDSGGWESTKAGLRNGASNHTAMSGVPYVKFEERVLREPALRRALSELSVPTQATQTPTQTQTMNEASRDGRVGVSMCVREVLDHRKDAEI